jgi:PKD repeat protein
MKTPTWLRPLRARLTGPGTTARRSRLGVESLEDRTTPTSFPFQQKLVETGTALHETGSNWVFDVIDWNHVGQMDLVAINMQGGSPGNESVDLHIFTGDSGFQSHVVAVQTGIRHHTIPTFYSFEMADWDDDGFADLIAIDRTGFSDNSSASLNTIVYAFSGASGFQTGIFGGETVLGQTTGSNWVFDVDDWDGGGKPDLIAINRGPTGTGTTELHAFSGESNFLGAIEHEGTALPYTNANWAFETAGQSLIGINFNNTASGQTDVYHVTGSGLDTLQTPVSTALHSGTMFAFEVVGGNLWAIKKSSTGTNSTEVHVFSGANSTIPAGQTVTIPTATGGTITGTYDAGSGNLAIVLQPGETIQIPATLGGELVTIQGPGTAVITGTIQAGQVALETGQFSLTSSSRIQGDVVVDGTPAVAGTLILGNTTDVVLPAGYTVDVGQYGDLEGIGAVGAGIILAGEVDPGNSPGRITTGPFRFTSTGRYRAELNGTAAGTGYDQLVVRGAVTLNAGATLLPTLGSGFNPAAGSTFTIIDNDGTDAVSGTFAGLAEGATLSIGGRRFEITYKGGTGNDVVLVRNSPPTGSNLSPSVNEDTALNGTLPKPDPNGDATTVALTDSPDKGTVSVTAATGAYTYTPAGNWSGTDSFKYRVSDGEMNSVEYTVTVTVNPVADVPTLAVTAASGSEAAVIPLSISPALTDTDGSESLSIRVSGVPAGATLSAGADAGGGVWNLTPAQLAGLSIRVPDDAAFALTVRATATDGGSTAFADRTLNVTVGTVNPTLTAVGNQTAAEGAVVSLPTVGTLTDPGFRNAAGGTDETFTYSINWGDGTAASAGTAAVGMVGSAGVLTAAAFGGSHTYADDGVYTVTVTVTDDDGGSDTETFQVTVANANPTLAVVGNQGVAEGASLALPGLATLTDPGFDNPLNPLAGGELAETFTYTVNWGDGTATEAGVPASSTGSPGVPTAGSFGGSHTYADDGVYTVTVTVADDDGGSDTETFTVTVANAGPTLAVVGGQAVAEGAVLGIADIGTFTDPGFDNPANPLAGGELTETFTYSVNWGDGTAADTGAATVDAAGSRAVLTAGSFDGQHIYADDGTYTVTVTVTDDDGGSDTRTFQVTVGTVNPTVSFSGSNLNLNAAGQPVPFSGVRGQPLYFDGTFTDPGFDNPALGSRESFTYSINWGDGTPADAGATAVTSGDRGVETTGSFLGRSHTYTAAGTYTVRVTVTDDDGGTTVITRTATIAVASLQVDGNFAVGGTTGDDDLVLAPGSPEGTVAVTLNKASLGTFAAGNRLLAFAQAGSDDVQVAGSIDRPAWVYGGDGADRLKGGAGHDVLLGEAGEDLVVGGQGRDYLIGGAGADRLVGNADDDVLVAGWTAYDADAAGLGAVMAEWTSGRSFADRVAALQAGVGAGGAYRLAADGAPAAVTVFDDGAADVLTGAAGLDWFLFNADGAAEDKVTDLSTYESLYAEDVAFMNAFVG